VRFLLFILILVTGCVENSSGTGYHPSFTVLANELGHRVLWQLMREKKLYAVEYGGIGGRTKPTKLLHCSFFYYKEVDIGEARELLMTAGNLLLKTLNANEKIRPCFANFPLTPKNIQVHIFLKNSDGSELGPEKLHVLSFTDGKLEYEIISSETHRLVTILVETYEEADAKLAAAVARL
jgi:hypothetical protein